jgi:hypothetical protein
LHNNAIEHSELQETLGHSKIDAHRFPPAQLSLAPGATIAVNERGEPRV